MLPGSSAGWSCATWARAASRAVLPARGRPNRTMWSGSAGASTAGGADTSLPSARGVPRQLVEPLEHLLPDQEVVYQHPHLFGLLGEGVLIEDDVNLQVRRLHPSFQQLFLDL